MTITCFDCINAKKISGCAPSYHDPGCPPEAECLLPESIITEEQANAAYDDATQCPGFSPVLVGGCAVCGRQIDAPLHSHTLFVYEYHSGEPLHVCSDACKAAQEEKETQKKADDERYVRELEHFSLG